MTVDPMILIRQIQAYDRAGEGDPNATVGDRSPVDAPRGATFRQTDTGDIWRKTTVLGVTSGWVTP